MADDNSVVRRVLGAAKMVVGAAFVYDGYRMLVRSTLPSALFGSTLRAAASASNGAQNAPGKILKTSAIVEARNINERVEYIQQKATIGSLAPRVKELVAAVLNRKCGDKWCIPEKNYAAEVKALFNAVRDVNGAASVRYVRDHAYVDQFVSAAKTLDLKIGDCDDMTILLAAMLICAGYPVNLRVVQADEPSVTSWSHIYLKAGLPPQDPTRWMALDLTVQQPAGWEVPGAEEALLSGQPAGLVKRTKDFPVWTPKYIEGAIKRRR